MGEYIINLEDGRSLTVKGEKPPTPAQVKAILADAGMSKSKFPADAADMPRPSAEQLPRNELGLLVNPSNKPKTMEAGSALGAAAGGVNRGLSWLLGLPVDVGTMGLEGLAQTIRPQTKEITGGKKPYFPGQVGGSDWLRENVFTGAGIEPSQGDLSENIASVAGENLPFFGGQLSRSAQAAESIPQLLKSLVPLSGTVVGGGTARTVAPDSAAADIAGQVIGGVGAAAIPGAATRVRRWSKEFPQAEAGQRLFNASPTRMAVADIGGQSIDDTARLAERTNAQFGFGQASDEPAKLSLQKEAELGTRYGQERALEVAINNDAALRAYVDKNIAQTGGGAYDDVVRAVEKYESAMSDSINNARTRTEILSESIRGMDKEAAGRAIRRQANNVKQSLKSQANKLYDKVPKDMKMDGTPILKAIEEVGGLSNPAFEKLGDIPRSMMNRAEGELAKQAITLGDLRTLRTQVGSEMQAARAAGNDMKAGALSKLRGGIDGTLDLATSSGQGKAADDLKIATDFYRDIYTPTVKHGSTAKILAQNAKREMVIDDALVGKSYFKANERGVAAAKSYNRTFGEDPIAKQAMRDYIANDALNSARNPATGKIETGRISRWLDNHKDSIRVLGFGDDIKTVDDALEVAMSFETRQAQYAKSSFSQAIHGADPDKLVRQVFKSGVNSGEIADTVIGIVGHDANALAGFKQMFKEHLMSKAGGGVPTARGQELLEYSKYKGVIDRYRPAMEKIYTANEMRAFDDVQSALEVIERTRKGSRGLGAREGLAEEPIAKVANDAAQGLTYRIRKVVTWGMKTLLKAEIDESDRLLVDAMYDPELAQRLINVATERRPVTVPAAGPLSLQTLSRVSRSQDE
jgi:hypothetical protein